VKKEQQKEVKKETAKRSEKRTAKRIAKILCYFIKKNYKNLTGWGGRGNLGFPT